MIPISLTPPPAPQKGLNHPSVFITSRTGAHDARHGPNSPFPPSALPSTAGAHELQPLRPPAAPSSDLDYLDPLSSASHLGGLIPTPDGASQAGTIGSYRSSMCDENQRQIDAIISGISDPSLRESVQDLLISRSRLDLGEIIGL